MVVKRDGTTEVFDRGRIEAAIAKAFRAVADRDEEDVRKIVSVVTDEVVLSLPEGDVSVERIQDLVEKSLMRLGHHQEAKAFILYRNQRSIARDLNKTFVQVDELASSYLGENDWRVRENANTTFSLQGMNNYFADALTARYWLHLLPEEVSSAHTEGLMHIHDLGIFAPYCCGWDLQQLLNEGFGGVPGKLNCNPPKHLGSALGQIVNFFYTLQGENAGAQAFSNFDTLMAPFVREENLSYEQVKQAIQEFVFNCNVATRVGFQCLSEDTEILTESGWRTYEQVGVGDIIATFNLDKRAIEYLPAKRVFARKYEGKMYNLKNRATDQLISPKHRVVRRLANTDHYVLEPIEQAFSLNGYLAIPLRTEGNVLGDDTQDEDWVRFAAWAIAKGTWRTEEGGENRFSICLPYDTDPDNCLEVEATLKRLGMNWERSDGEWGQNTSYLYRLDEKSSCRVALLFGSTKEVGFAPASILNLSPRLSKFFFDTYARASNGKEEGEASTTREHVRDLLMMVAANAGYCATCCDGWGDRPDYIVKLLVSDETYIREILEVDYEGVIWCPNTDNETVIARRNGKVFITGNTPFTNLTLDVTVPKTFADDSATIAGEILPYKYGDLQKEMDMLNRALAEILMEGDASGRPFTFPIPTYNIWKGEDYEHERWDPIWKMTAETGLPYFANFINSDMTPEQVRSMCCRLRLDHGEMKRRLGGLFGSTPLTGSVAVVTINLVRAALEAKSVDEYLDNLRRVVSLAETALVARRKIIDDMTENGLYPYSKHFLRHVKEKNGGYWSQHFLTIGICGAHEAALELLGKGIDTVEGSDLAETTMDTLLELVEGLNQKHETERYMFNLEATPAEGASVRLAKVDAKRFPSCYAARNGGKPYTGSTMLPVDSQLSLYDALCQQESLQAKYTGGTVFHTYLGQPLSDFGQARKLVFFMCSEFRMPYLTLSPVYSICHTHGRMPGEQKQCPTCGSSCEVWSRIVGYYRPVSQWSGSKQKEHDARVYYRSDGV
jgi:anaerobic ribonucleoside-triphosphate reductase